MAQFLDLMAEVEDDSDGDDSSELDDDEIGEKEWEALINDETEEAGSVTEEDEAKFTHEEDAEASTNTKDDPLWNALIGVNNSEDDFSTDSEEEKASTPLRYSPTPPPDPPLQRKPKHADLHSRTLQQLQNTPPVSSSRQTSSVNTPRRTPHISQAHHGQPTPPTSSVRHPNTPSEQHSSVSPLYTDGPHVNDMNKSPTQHKKNKSTNGGTRIEGIASSQSTIRDDNGGRPEETTGSDLERELEDPLDDTVIRKKRIEEHAIQEGLLSRKRIRGRFNKKIYRANEVDRDRLRLALGITSHKHSHRIRKKCRELLVDAEISLVRCWAEMSDAERVKAVNVLYSHFNPIFSWWTVGLVRDLTMVILRDNKRNTTSKEKGYKPYAHRDKEYAPRRKPKYAPTVLLQRSEKERMEADKETSEEAIFEEVVPNSTTAARGNKQPTPSVRETDTETQQRVPGQIPGQKLSKVNEKKNPATNPNARSVSDAPEEQQSDYIDEDGGFSREASMESNSTYHNKTPETDGGQTLQLQRTMEEDLGTSEVSMPSATCFRVSTSPQASVTQDERNSTAHLRSDTDARIEAPVLRDSSPCDDESMAQGKTKRPGHSDSISDLPHERSSVDRVEETPSPTSNQAQSDVQRDNSSPQDSAPRLMLPPGFVPPRPQKAVLRIEFVAGMVDVSPISSFTSPLYRNSTLKEFLLTVEQHIHPIELDVTASLLCYLPTSHISQDGLGGNWKVIKGSQDLIGMFSAHANGSCGVYMCQVEIEKIKTTYWRFVDNKHYDRNAYARKIKSEGNYDGPLLDEDIYDMSELTAVQFERPRNIWFPDGTCKSVTYEDQLLDEDGCDEEEFKKLSMSRSRSTSFVHSKRETPAGNRASSKLQSVIRMRKDSIIASRSMSRQSKTKTPSSVITPSVVKPSVVNPPAIKQSVIITRVAHEPILMSSDPPILSSTDGRNDTIKGRRLGKELPNVSVSPFFARRITEEDVQKYFSVSTDVPHAGKRTPKMHQAVQPLVEGQNVNKATGNSSSSKITAGENLDVTPKAPKEVKLKDTNRRARISAAETPWLFASPVRASSPVRTSPPPQVHPLPGVPKRGGNTSTSTSEVCHPPTNSVSERSSSKEMEVQLFASTAGQVPTREDLWVRRLKQATVGDYDSIVTELLSPDFDIAKVKPKYLKLIDSYLRKPAARAPSPEFEVQRKPCSDWSASSDVEHDDQPNNPPATKRQKLEGSTSKGADDCVVPSTALPRTASTQEQSTYDDETPSSLKPSSPAVGRLLANESDDLDQRKPATNSTITTAKDILLPDKRGTVHIDKSKEIGRSSEGSAKRTINPKSNVNPLGKRKRNLEDPCQWEIQATPSPEPERVPLVTGIAIDVVNNNNTEKSASDAQLKTVDNEYKRQDGWVKPSPVLKVQHVNDLSPTPVSSTVGPSLNQGWKKVPKRLLTVQQEEEINPASPPISMEKTMPVAATTTIVTKASNINEQKESDTPMSTHGLQRMGATATQADTGLRPEEAKTKPLHLQAAPTFRATRGAVRRLTVMQSPEDDGHPMPCPSLDELFKQVGFPDKRSRWNRSIKIMAVGISERYKRMKEKGEFHKINWKEVGKASLAAHNVAIGETIQHSQQTQPDNALQLNSTQVHPTRKPSRSGDSKQRKPSMSQPNPFNAIKKGKAKKRVKPIHQGTSPAPEIIPPQPPTSDLIVCDFTEVREKIAKALLAKKNGCQ